MSHLIGLRFLALIALVGGVEICGAANSISETKLKPNVNVINISQKEFDELVEKVARTDLSNVDAVSNVTGVEWKHGENFDSTKKGWATFVVKSASKNVGFEVTGYDWMFDSDNSQSQKISLQLAQLEMQFPLKAKLSCDNLFFKYNDKPGELESRPAKEVCNIFIGNTHIYMDNPHKWDADGFKYVYQVTFVWRKNMVKNDQTAQ